VPGNDGQRQATSANVVTYLSSTDK